MCAAVIILAVLVSCSGPESNSPQDISALAGAPKAKNWWGDLVAGIPNNIGNAITADPATTRTVTWLSTHQTGELIIGRKHYESESIKHGNYYHHRVNLGDLAAGTSYQYIAGTPGYYSPVYTFTTAGANSQSGFFVLHITDPQIGAGGNRGDAAVWQRVIESAVKECPEAAFIVNTGDIVEDAIESVIPFYFDYAQKILANYAFVYSMGNNDTVNWYNVYFYTPANGSGGKVYSFDYGNAHFINIDSNGALTQSQLTWLENDLKNTAQKWKVVMTHEADYGRSGNNTAVTKLLDKYNVDLVMAGHNHFYARSKPIDSAGNAKQNGTVWTIPNTCGTKFNDTSGAAYLAVDKQPKLPMFSVFRFTQANIYLNAYTVDASGSASLYDTYTW